MISRFIETGNETPAGAADQVVGRIRTSLATRIGEDSVARYFDDRVRLDYAPGRLDVRTPTKFMANLLGRRFGSALRDAASAATGTSEIEVAFGVDPSAVGQDAETEGATDGVAAGASEAPGRNVEVRERSARRGMGSGDRGSDRGGTGLGARSARRYLLGEFIVGPTNRLAYEASCQFAERRMTREAGERTGPATLFLHGLCGLGKTHLLHGIASRFAENNPGAVVRVVTGETFTNEFITAVQAGKKTGVGGVGGLDRFRRSYRRVDLLCIDDVHFLTSKSATQSELLHTFDELDLGGACIVLASDEHPRQVKKFSDALVSRFMAGLVTRIEPPDQTLCTRLVQVLAQRRGLVMDEGVVRAIVARIAPIAAGAGKPGGGAGAGGGAASVTSVRDIEGLMTRIEAYANLAGTNTPEAPVGRGAASRRVGMSTVQHAFGQQWGASPAAGNTAAPERRTPTPVVVAKAGQAGRTLKLDQITAHVNRVLGVEFDELAGNGRRPQVVLARSLISHLARRLTTLSFPEIARGIGRPTHSTIIAACQRLEAQMAAENQPTVDLGGTVLTVKELCERMEGELGRGV